MISQTMSDKDFWDKVEPPATIAPSESYREEETRTGDWLDSSNRNNEEGISNPSGRMTSDIPNLKTRKGPLKLATWNVRSLSDIEKLDNLILELKSMNIDMAGISEVRWKDAGKTVKEGYTMMYSGGDSHKNGVAIIMKNKIACSLIGLWPVDDRIIAAKIAAQPFNIFVIQVYAPTSDYDDDQIEFFYEKLNQILLIAKSDDIVFIMGDFNAKVGREKISRCMGKHGIGKRNNRGERLLQFCEENNMIIANTLFKHPARRIYTWKSPGDVCRNQIDYIMVKERFRNIVKQAKAYPGADINSDHNPVVIKASIKPKVIRKGTSKEKLDLDLLKESKINEKFNEEFRNNFDLASTSISQIAQTREDIDNMWKAFKESINIAAAKTIPKSERRKKQPWMTEDILVLIEERKN